MLSARTAGPIAPAPNVPAIARTARTTAIRRNETRAVRPINKGEGLHRREVVRLSSAAPRNKPLPLIFDGKHIRATRVSEVSCEVRDLRARAALNRGSVSEDRVLEVELGEFFDRFPMLLRIHIVPVVHGSQTGLVVDRIPCKEEGTSRIEE